MIEMDDTRPATKGELKHEIAGLKAELKADIHLLDQKFGQLDQKFNQLDQKTSSLGLEMAKTQLRIDRLESSIMTELRSFKSELLGAFEASVVKGRMYEQKAFTHGDMLSAHEDKISDHETRITVIETESR